MAKRRGYVEFYTEVSMGTITLEEYHRLRDEPEEPEDDE